MEPVEYQIESDGRTVWVNGPGGGAIGRFGRLGAEIHHTIDVQISKGTECLLCIHRPCSLDEWHIFIAGMVRNYGIIIGDEWRPTWMIEDPMKKFKKAKAYTTAHENGDHYVVVYDHAAGRKDRYTVLAWGADSNKALVIGREVELEVANRHPAKRTMMDSEQHKIIIIFERILRDGYLDRSASDRRRKRNRDKRKLEVLVRQWRNHDDTI